MIIQNQNIVDLIINADVIVVNDDIAVAIKYDDRVDSAPIIIAKGTNEMALYICKIASDIGVDIIQNESLALSLYKALGNVGDPIPELLYAAVAEMFFMIRRSKTVSIG